MQGVGTHDCWSVLELPYGGQPTKLHVRGDDWIALEFGKYWMLLLRWHASFQRPVGKGLSDEWSAEWRPAHAEKHNSAAWTHMRVKLPLCVQPGGLMHVSSPGPREVQQRQGNIAGFMLLPCTAQVARARHARVRQRRAARLRLPSRALIMQLTGACGGAAPCARGCGHIHAL